MNSIKEVYDALKKHDSENKLILNDDNQEIELKGHDNNRVIVGDDYLVVILGKKEVTHWHPDYKEAYAYLLDIMNGKEKLPTKKDVRIGKLAGTIEVLVAMIILGFSNYIWTLSDGLMRIVIVIVAIIVFVAICKVIEKIFANALEKRTKIIKTKKPLIYKITLILQVGWLAILAADMIIMLLFHTSIFTIESGGGDMTMVYGLGFSIMTIYPITTVDSPIQATTHLSAYGLIFGQVLLTSVNIIQRSRLRKKTK